MPTYEYRCPEGHDFERFYRSISAAESVVACPECGKVAERRLSAGAGFAFKGSGFYLTDYGKNAHRTSGAANASEGGAKEGGTKEGGSKEGGSKEGGSKEGGSSTSGDSAAKPAAPSESKPAAAKSETKPASTGPTPKSDK
jgi:putative FmdB family regulatory protein